MGPQVKFTAYVLSVVDAKRICVRIDQEYIDAVSTVLSSFNDKTVIKSTVIVNVNDCVFNINNIEWSELSHLIGVHLKLNVTFRRYNYWRTREVLDDNNIGRVTAIKYKGVSIIAKQISNVI